MFCSLGCFGTIDLAINSRMILQNTFGKELALAYAWAEPRQLVFFFLTSLLQFRIKCY